MRCFKCERTIVVMNDFGEPLGNCLDGAGRFTPNFGYGSVHDSESPHGFLPTAEFAALSLAEQLDRCDRVVGYICDDCYEKYAHLLEGYSVREQRPVATRRV